MLRRLLPAFRTPMAPPAGFLRPLSLPPPDADAVSMPSSSILLFFEAADGFRFERFAAY